MKTSRGCLVVWLLALSTAPALSGATVVAQENSDSKVALRIKAGEVYVIEGLSREAAARIKVVANPKALVVNGQAPGRLVLVGAEAGKWEISAERADGRAVTYEVTVSSIARPLTNPLAPGKLPSAADAAFSGNFSVERTAETPATSAPETIEVNP